MTLERFEANQNLAARPFGKVDSPTFNQAIDAASREVRDRSGGLRREHGSGLTAVPADGFYRFPPMANNHQLVRFHRDGQPALCLHPSPRVRAAALRRRPAGAFRPPRDAASLREPGSKVFKRALKYPKISSIAI